MDKKEKKRIEGILQKIETAFAKKSMHENEKQTKKQLEDILAGISSEEKETIIQQLKERKHRYSKELLSNLYNIDKLVRIIKIKPAAGKKEEPVIEEEEPEVEKKKPIKEKEKPVVEKEEPEVETIEKQEKIISLNTGKIEKLIADILKDQDMIKKIERLKVTRSGNWFDIDAKIWVNKFFQNIDISLKWRLINAKDGIAASLHEVGANKFENKVRKAMEDNLWKLGTKMKEYFERKYDKAIEKIQIEDGKLNIYFSREEETIPGDDLKKMMEEMNKITDGLKELKDQNKTIDDQLKRVQEERKNIENELGEKTE